MDGFSLPDKRTDQVILEANPEYWDTTRLPRLHRIIFDNTLAQRDAVELVKTGEGHVDLVSELSPLVERFVNPLQAVNAYKVGKV